MTFGSLLPPAFRNLVHQWRASREPVFPTFDAAMQSRGKGYNDTELANLVLRKTKAFVQTDVVKGISDHQAMCTLVAINTAAAASQRGMKPLRVLDFGGALGTSYYLAKALMPGAYQWAVVESAVFADAAQDLGRDTPELRIFPGISEATAWLGGVDLLYSSSTLQYLPDADPFLDEMLAARPACVAWLRTAFSRTDKVVVLQQSRLIDNGPGPAPTDVKDRPVYYPRSYISLPDFLARFKDAYRQVIRLGDGTPETKIGGRTIIMGDFYLFLRHPNK